MHIEVRNLNKSFGNHQAVNDVSFTIERGKLIGLLGPSGGGKSTLLRILAGLETPDSGDIFIDGKRVNDVQPQLRGIGFVFQNYALFKHMNVFDNIAFGLTIRKMGKAEIKDRVHELLDLTGLRGFEHRYPNQLSGGQRQRVAFARALAPRPNLLLLDEPFAAIDAKVRKELRTWLKSLIAEIGITSIFVTHDQDEAVEVADEMLIVQQGKLEQQGSPIHIYTDPRTAFVAGFIGNSSVVEQPGSLRGFENTAYGAGARAIIRPEFVEVGRKNEIPFPSAAEKGKVRHVFFRGAHLELDVEIGDNRLSAHRSLDQEPLQPGEEVVVLIHRLYVISEESATMVENPLKVDPLPVHI
ncbi:ABC transporter ATP-binding protein [Paenibacillus sacheonensis]|uniref:Carnitine transport ATP-binding protein OpuCA n=1 Tax=Paenibacillus sacheonensis TaxID=742054 RepID=A0A7X4YNV1_9BACL|nr:sulfate ABC transporter ATP-binding protein [Paenibacillus sacheonensis]MBM7567455.1 sulfate transport system ATP-binding protein [Paenibacillus sacheonensis]NBC69762.1 sulfate ABC transporter ATP-binding protein [Paenibacillus sacheonensis]